MAVISHSEPLFDDVLVRPAQPGQEDVVPTCWPRPLPGSTVEASRNGPALPDELRPAQIAGGEALLVGEAQHPIATAKAAERGRQYVRPATASNNPALRRYYERAGFKHVDDPSHARWPTSLYERKVGTVGRNYGSDVITADRLRKFPPAAVSRTRRLKLPHPERRRIGGPVTGSAAWLRQSGFTNEAQLLAPEENVPPGTRRIYTSRLRKFDAALRRVPGKRSTSANAAA